MVSKIAETHNLKINLSPVVAKKRRTILYEPVQITTQAIEEITGIISNLIYIIYQKRSIFFYP